jgi:HEPN domain-containing protein
MAQRFFQQSQRDLEAARKLVTPDTAYAAALLAHQAAEKALKAVCWHVRAEEPPWRHELLHSESLIEERIGGLPTEVREAIRYLEPVYARTRYPSPDESEPIPADLVTEFDARLAIGYAEEVMRWVHVLLQTPPGRPR